MAITDVEESLGVIGLSRVEVVMDKELKARF
jgi:hypothetical protein